MVLVVDLKVRKFSEDDSAWRLFPGVGYWHFDTMEEYGRVFLEYSDLPLPEQTGFEDDRQVLNAIVKGQ